MDAYDVIEMMEEKMEERFCGMLIAEAEKTLKAEGWIVRLEDNGADEPDEYSEFVYIELSDVYGCLEFYDEYLNSHPVILEVYLRAKE